MPKSGQKYTKIGRFWPNWAMTRTRNATDKVQGAECTRGRVASYSSWWLVHICWRIHLTFQVWVLSVPRYRRPDRSSRWSTVFYQTPCTFLLMSKCGNCWACFQSYIWSVTGWNTENKAGIDMFLKITRVMWMMKGSTEFRGGFTKYGEAWSNITTKGLTLENITYGPLPVIWML